jgi:predicted O-methyltransferase YrrM
MNEIIRSIYTTGYVKDADGHSYPHNTSSVTFDVGHLLYEFVRVHRPLKTLEIGMAYGASTLFICQAHRDNGCGHHSAIDPFEETSYESIGLLNMERANLKDLLSFFPAPSDLVLPQLHAQNEQFDFVFIDGNHLFDYALVDFFFADKLLNIGGHIAIDDLWMPSVRKVASFVLRNKPYRLLSISSEYMPTTWEYVLQTGTRILQNPFGRDWRLKLHPSNVAFFEKIAADSRSWKFHRSF